MYVGLVELEELTETLETGLALVEFDANGLVTGQFGKGTQHVENQVLVGREHLDQSRPRVHAVAGQETPVTLLLDRQVPVCCRQLGHHRAARSGQVLVAPDAQVAVQQSKVLLSEQLGTHAAVGAQILHHRAQPTHRLL